MPYENKHVAILIDAEEFETFAVENPEDAPEGVDYVVGTREDGSTDLQRIQFEADMYSIEDVGAWIEEQGLEAIEIQEATGEKESDESEQSDEMEESE